MKILFFVQLMQLLIASAFAADAKGILGRAIVSDVEQERKLSLTDRRRRRRLSAKLVEAPSPRRLTEKVAPIVSRRSRTSRSLPYYGMGKGTSYYTDDAYKASEPPVYYDDEIGSYDDAYVGKSGMMSGMSGMSGMGGMMSGGSKKGMMSSKNGKGKGKGKGKGGVYPSVDDVTFLDDAVYDDAFWNGDECQMVSFNETFAIPGPTLFLAPDTSASDPGTPSLPGTVFILELVNVLELDGETPIDGSTVSGTCTRTTIGSDGGGTCQFVFIDDEGYSITVNGFLPGPLGGPMAISGGTGSMVGVFGDMDFFPIFTDMAATGDIFLDVVRYEVIADIGLIVCPY